MTIYIYKYKTHTGIFANRVRYSKPQYYADLNRLLKDHPNAVEDDLYVEGPVYAKAAVKE